MKDVDILDQLDSIHYAILCYEHGKLDEFIADNSEPTDEYFNCFFSAMYAAVDFINEDYDEAYEVNKFYFSWKSMVEYYRLCREYSVKLGISLKKNPYMLEAEDFVERAMLFDGYGGGYGFYLQTKVGHKWASGLLFRTDCYFNSEFELAEALMMIGAWYEKGVERLRAELEKPKIVAFPQNAPHKEAA